MNGINTKHFETGSKCPSIDPEKLTVYNMRYCPFAQRTILVLLKKNIPFDTINVSLSKKPEWFLERNPLGKVPTIQIGDKIIYESIITVDYIDQVYGGETLNQKDPYQDALDRMLIERFSQALPAHYRLYYGQPSEVTPEQRKAWSDEMLEKLHVLEEALGERQTPYFGGDSVKMVDYLIWPWFERILAMPAFAPECALDPKRFARVVKWIDLMEQDSAVKAYRISSEDFLEFRRSKLEGNTNYNIIADRQ